MPMKGTLFLSISIYLACFFDNSFLSLLVNVVVLLVSLGVREALKEPE